MKFFFDEKKAITEFLELELNSGLSEAEICVEINTLLPILKAIKLGVLPDVTTMTGILKFLNKSRADFEVPLNK